VEFLFEFGFQVSFVVIFYLEAVEGAAEVVGIFDATGTCQTLDKILPFVYI
jgi:hypothetical protein